MMIRRRINSISNKNKNNNNHHFLLPCGLRRSRRRNHNNHYRLVVRILILLIIATLCIQLIIQIKYLPSIITNKGSSHYLYNTNYHQQPLQQLKQQYQYRQYQQQPTLYSCNDLFGRDQIVNVRKGNNINITNITNTNNNNNNKNFKNNNNCIQHKKLLWLSCYIGPIDIDTTKIDGSLGGESLFSKTNNDTNNTTKSIMGRNIEEEYLSFHKGSLVLLLKNQNDNDHHQIISSNNVNDNNIIPYELLQQTMDSTIFGQFLNSAIIVRRSSSVVDAVDHHDTSAIVSSSSSSSSSNSNSSDNITTSTKKTKPEEEEANDQTETTATTLLLVRRGNYANPCMSILNMYNVYIVMKYFNLLSLNSTNSTKSTKTTTTTKTKILWLDGHAKGDLDPVWEQLFATKPIHIKQYHSRNISKNNNAIVVNTMSSIGDEGYGQYDWGGGGGSSTTISSRKCMNNSTLIDFRNFVLERYGLLKQQQQQHKNTTKEKKILTFLVRKEYYIAHPRSSTNNNNGHNTDRTIANITSEIEYLQNQYPNHTIHVVSFEGMEFVEQLRHIIQTNIFVSVHGAGNIHVLFLPLKANTTFIEYFPKGYERRKRFQFLANCLPNINYEKKIAYIQSKDPTDGKITVRLHQEEMQ